MNELTDTIGEWLFDIERFHDGEEFRVAGNDIEDAYSQLKEYLEDSGEVFDVHEYVVNYKGLTIDHGFNEFDYDTVHPY